eukprot:gnl/Spiro4/26098_TR13019_c0_g1_i1.p1 gnl/Spiro4/26098_TR13019_c0_g1~~gnl/Spiro4/26098_TR13019_c0_g1_i1.p1  ORF type:complete len:157 (+),score=22.93 gnl/Spiro4/26098_TR13019_c0_g1_i1:31-471(+)
MHVCTTIALFCACWLHCALSAPSSVAVKNDFIALESPVSYSLRSLELMEATRTAAMPPMQRELDSESHNMLSWIDFHERMELRLRGMSAISDSRRKSLWWIPLETMGLVVVVLGGTLGMAVCLGILEVRWSAAVHGRRQEMFCVIL